MRPLYLWGLPGRFAGYPGRWVPACWETRYWPYHGSAPRMHARQRQDGDVDVRELQGGYARSTQVWGEAQLVPTSYWRGEGIVLYRMTCAVCATYVKYEARSLARYVCGAACLRQLKSQCALNDWGTEGIVVV